MRRLARSLATLARTFRALRSASDERNIQRLARHFDYSLEDAREVYVHARREGFGAAQAALFSRSQARREPGRRRTRRP